jgi:cysteine-rich repeat protein
MDLPLGSEDTSSCGLSYSTYWPVNTERTVTCNFDSGDYLDYLFYASVDNDIINCTLNGELLFEDYEHENCAEEDPRDNGDSPFPVGVVPEMGSNTLKCVVNDRGSMSHFDACLVGETECEESETDCDDGVDNDCDGDVDENDSDCWECGNGLLEGSEECDDGNDQNGDGCSDTCTLEYHDICNYTTYTCENVLQNITGDSCSANSDCFQEICNYTALACEKVHPETQGDSCSADADCYHMECDYGQGVCEMAEGSGPNECNEDVECERVCDPEINMISNGGFESPMVTHSAKWDIFPNGTSGLGWMVDWESSETGYGGENRPETANVELHRGVQGWTIAEGQQYAELDSDWDGPDGSLSGEPASSRISQELATIPGEVYTVTFMFSPRPDTVTGNNVLEFSWAGSVEDTISYAGSTDTNWTIYTYSFTATDWITRIEFADIGDADSLGTFLDNVSAECVDKEALCGDGTVQEWEECDDGNSEDYDGCSSGCEIEDSTKIVARKVICPEEDDLPNWGAGGPNVDNETAEDFLEENSDCWLAENWSFQWADNSASDPTDNMGELGSPWNTFGPTDENGTALIDIYDLGDGTRFKVREVWQDAYINFSGANTDQDVSAEMYCHTDVLKYDNYDFINAPELNETYYCVAFNVLACTPELMNTTPSEWYDISECFENDTKKQERSWIQYDYNFCGEDENQTFYEYRWEECDYCTPELVNTTVSNWTNITVCSNGTLTQMGQVTQYDNNSCGEVDNQTFDVYQNISCQLCGNNFTEGTEECDDGNNIDGDDCSAVCTWEYHKECTYSEFEPANVTDTQFQPYGCFEVIGAGNDSCNTTDDCYRAACVPQYEIEQDTDNFAYTCEMHLSPGDDECRLDGEICNGLDDDCDLEIDENLTNGTTSCGVGACASTGEMVCENGTFVDNCVPGDPEPEVCGDGIDNDCDGSVDEGCGGGGSTTLSFGGQIELPELEVEEEPECNCSRGSASLDLVSMGDEIEVEVEKLDDCPADYVLLVTNPGLVVEEEFELTEGDVEEFSLDGSGNWIEYRIRLYCADAYEEEQIDSPIDEIRLDREQIERQQPAPLTTTATPTPTGAFLAGDGIWWIGALLIAALLGLFTIARRRRKSKPEE